MHRGNGVCPLLLNPEYYQPDTIDLIKDVKERNYWLTCLEQMVKKFIGKASILNPDNPNAKEDAEKCFYTFHKLVEELKEDPT